MGAVKLHLLAGEVLETFNGWIELPKAAASEAQRVQVLLNKALGLLSDGAIQCPFVLFGNRIAIGIAQDLESIWALPVPAAPIAWSAISPR